MKGRARLIGTLLATSCVAMSSASGAEAYATTGCKSPTIVEDGFDTYFFSSSVTSSWQSATNYAASRWNSAPP